MAPVDHGGNTIETEAIELKFVQPVFAVGKQEVKHFILAVVEAEGVPGLVVSANRITMEIKIAGAIHAGQSFGLIFYGMRMYNVHDHGNAHLMGGVDQLTQFIGRAAAGGGCKETGYMIAERPIVGMLLDSHDLDGVVSVLFYTGKDIFPEFVVGTYLFLAGGHAYMGFVDEQRRGVGHKAGLAEPVWLLRFPHLCTENISGLVLYNPLAPGWNTFPGTTFPVYLELVEIEVMNAFQRDGYLPDTVVFPF